ncbi:MAG: DUF2723 domain-containing protein [Candidatus Aureabacteria bacterium]|nr:DUF2723 domain-containing protein [Candidatus Auribacterota bacterium]
MAHIALLICVALLAVYVYGSAPNWGAMTLFNTWDGLEYVICSYLLGIDHPPGHPTYLLLGRLFTMMPFGDPAWSINLLSSVFGAIAATLLFLISFELLAPAEDRRIRSLLAAAISLSVAFSYVFWIHCGIPEVHTLFLSCVGACVYALLRWHGTGMRRWLNASAIALAMGLGVNLLGVMAIVLPVALFLAVSVRTRGTRIRDLIPPLLLFFAGFLAYLYYPLRIGKAVYSHPMNYLAPYEMGTRAWYLWYISGKSWTGGQMFFMSRVLANLPLYLRFAVRDLGVPLFAIAVVSCVRGFVECLRAVRARATVIPREGVLLPFLCILFLCSLLPAVSIHDPSNPRAWAYLQNFFLPSLYLLVFPAAWGTGRLYRALRARGAFSAWCMTAILCSVPVIQYGMNVRSCMLRGDDCAYALSLRTLDQLRDGSVIASKLVFGMITTYFTEVDRKIPGTRVTIYDPELVTRRLSKESRRKDLFARRNSEMCADLDRLRREGRQVFLAGDIVDEDKSPEKLLISDLDLSRWFPTLTPRETRLTFPRELYLYQMTGVRQGEKILQAPPNLDRGMANAGRFANGIELLGFRPSDTRQRVRDDALVLEFCWRAAVPVGGDLYLGVIFMDARMRRLGEPCWHTVGGGYGASRWRPGETICDNVTILPPPLLPGRYLVAVGMVDGGGEEVKYLPADTPPSARGGVGPGREYDYVLLGPFEIGWSGYAKEE